MALPPIIYRIGADISDFITGTNSAIKRVNALSAAISSIIAAQALKAAYELGVHYTLLEARVTRLSDSTAEATQNMNTLMEISNKTGSSIKDTVAQFSSMSATLKELGASNSDVTDLVKILQQIGVVGGSSSEEMSNALRQFSQSLAGGVIRAEEFNSILDQMPELARQIAYGMNKSMGEMREAMLSGQLTADKVLTALYSRAGTVEAQFAKIPRTLAQSMNEASNSLSQAMSNLDKSLGVTDALVSHFDELNAALKRYNGENNERSVLASLELQVKENEKLTSLYVKKKRAQDIYNNAIKDGEGFLSKASKMEINRLNTEIDAIEKVKDARRREKMQATGIGVLPSNIPTGGGAREFINKMAVIAQEKKAAEERKKAQKEQQESSDKNTKSQQKMNQELQITRLETQGLGRDAAMLRAEFSVDTGAAPDVYKKQVADARAAAGEIYDLEQAQRSASSASKDGIKTETEAARAAKQREEAIAQMSRELQIAQLETSGLSREAAMLQAQWRIDDGATSDQINSIRAMAASIYDLNEAKRKSEEKEQKKTEAGEFIKSVTKEAMSPAEQIDAEESEKLAKLKGYQDLELEGLTGFEDAKTAIIQDAVKQREALQIESTSAILNATSSMFSGMADLAEKSVGEASGAYKAMFALSRGFAIANASLNLYTAVSQALADPTAVTAAQKMANMSAIGTAGASLVSSITSVSYGGGRENGGTANPGSFYRVGEGGKPELFESGGKQYLIPGDSTGSVTSNRNAFGQDKSGITIINTIDGDTVMQSVAGSSAFDTAVINSISANKDIVRMKLK